MQEPCGKEGKARSPKASADAPQHGCCKQADGQPETGSVHPVAVVMDALSVNEIEPDQIKIRKDGTQQAGSQDQLFGTFERAIRDIAGGQMRGNHMSAFRAIGFDAQLVEHTHP